MYMYMYMHMYIDNDFFVFSQSRAFQGLGAADRDPLEIGSTQLRRAWADLLGRTVLGLAVEVDDTLW